MKYTNPIYNKEKRLKIKIQFIKHFNEKINFIFQQKIKLIKIFLFNKIKILIKQKIYWNFSKKT